MRPSPRRHLSYASFTLLLVADVFVLSVLLLNQWLDFAQPWVWVLSTMATAATMPALLKLSDKVFAMARATRNIPWAGESFP